MNNIIKGIEGEQVKNNFDFEVGDTIRVHNKIKEGDKERIQNFEGTVLKKQGGSARETFTVRKMSDKVGVERVFPVNSPNVVKVDVLKIGRVRIVNII